MERSFLQFSSSSALREYSSSAVLSSSVPLSISFINFAFLSFVQRYWTATYLSDVIGRFLRYPWFFFHWRYPSISRPDARIAIDPGSLAAIAVLLKVTWATPDGPWVVKS